MSGRIARVPDTAGTSYTGPQSLTTGGRLAPRDLSVVDANTRVAVRDPDVRTLANERGVVLARVTGTGPNGTVTRTDVLAAAAAQDAERAAAQRRAFPVARPKPAWEIPPFTASGIDPRALLDVPAPVRPAMAAAPDHATAYAMREKYRGLSDDEARAALARDRSVPTTYGGLGTPAGVWPGEA